MVLWIVHPIQVSTVLYVVQRMTLLASLFVLLGIVGYLFGRQLHTEGAKATGILLMTVSPLVGAVLGLLSKENGVLLYAYLGVIELFLLHKLIADGPDKRLARYA